jgi:hypothetical protein
MKGASTGPPIHFARFRAHHIDNLEEAISSDTVDIEVNADSYCRLLPPYAV